jgi:hypothetical protein
MLPSPLAGLPGPLWCAGACPQPRGASLQSCHARRGPGAPRAPPRRAPPGAPRGRAAPPPPASTPPPPTPAPPAPRTPLRFAAPSAAACGALSLLQPLRRASTRAPGGAPPGPPEPAPPAGRSLAAAATRQAVAAAATPMPVVSLTINGKRVQVRGGGSRGSGNGGQQPGQRECRAAAGGGCRPAPGRRRAGAGRGAAAAPVRRRGPGERAAAVDARAPFHVRPKGAAGLPHPGRRRGSRNPHPDVRGRGAQGRRQHRGAPRAERVRPRQRRPPAPPAAFADRAPAPPPLLCRRLCKLPGKASPGLCRLCMVDVNGVHKPACCTPVVEGTFVSTDAPAVHGRPQRGELGRACGRGPAGRRRGPRPWRARNTAAQTPLCPLSHRAPLFPLPLALQNRSETTCAACCR